MRISAVVPVLNEVPTLRELHRRLSDVLAPIDDEHDVVFVNDGSSDGSAATLEAIARDDRRVVVVDLRRRFGKSAALAAGFAEARGDILVTLDGDLQDVPEEVPRLLARIRAGADLVTGRKRDRRDPWTRRAASFVFNRAASFITGTVVRDMNSGLKAIRREVVTEIPLHGELHRFLPALAQARGFKVEEIDVAHEPRRFGTSRYGLERYVGGFLDPITVLMLTRFGKRPLHFFGPVGSLLVAAGAAIIGYLTVGWFRGQWIGSRPLLPLGVLLLILGLQSVFFGLLAELIVVLGNERDPGFSVRRVLRGGAAGPPREEQGEAGPAEESHAGPS